MRQSVKALLSIRELIFNGKLAPGERLSELTLVERVGVSRTPLRMALVKLEGEGLLEAIPTGGFMVRAFSEADIFDAIEIRGTLEGLAARMAAEKSPTRSQLQELDKCLGEIDAIVRRRELSVEDFSRYVELNEFFHKGILRLAQSPALERQLARATAAPFASPNAFVMAEAELPESHGILFVAQDQHRCLLDAIEAGEGARAEAVAREHARMAKRNLQIVLGNRKAREQVPGVSLLDQLSSAVGS